VSEAATTPAPETYPVISFELTEASVKEAEGRAALAIVETAAVLPFSLLIPTRSVSEAATTPAPETYPVNRELVTAALLETGEPRLEPSPTMIEPLANVRSLGSIDPGPEVSTVISCVTNLPDGSYTIEAGSVFAI